MLECIDLVSFLYHLVIAQAQSSGFCPENNGAKTLAGAGHVAPRSIFIPCGVGCVNDVSCVACSQAHLIVTPQDDATTELYSVA